VSPRNRRQRRPQCLDQAQSDHAIDEGARHGLGGEGAMTPRDCFLVKRRRFDAGAMASRLARIATALSSAASEQTSCRRLRGLPFSIITSSWLRAPEASQD
jgi:hypothetical protein